jgi:type IV secretion system protein VirD4
MLEKFKENRIMMTGGGLGLVFAVLLGIKIAPPLEKGGLMYLINHQNEIMQGGFQIVKSTPAAILMCMLIYTCLISYAIYTGKKYRHGREKGSAVWSSAEYITNKFSNRKSFFKNKLFSQNVRIGFDGKKHHRNLNTLIIGGSGAGKTRTFAIPNILQGETSLVVLDPKGEMLRATGHYLKEIAGYKIKVVDLKNPKQSYFYNPFHYVENEMDMLRLVEILFKATTPKNAGGVDPFWDNSARVLFQAVAFYLFFECEKSELTFSNILYMIREGISMKTIAIKKALLIYFLMS